jgi:hypothetical protein
MARVSDYPALAYRYYLSRGIAPRSLYNPRQRRRRRALKNAADDKKATTVVVNDPDDLKGTLKRFGGSQSDA